MSGPHAELRCEHCQQVTDHELRYVGRLLGSVRCTVCGSHVELSQRARLPAYVADLEQRVASKPERMLRRAATDPVAFARYLPRAVARQPKKFVRELWDLLRR